MSRDNELGLLILSDEEENDLATSSNYLPDLNSFFLICQRTVSSCPLLLCTYLELKHHLFTKYAIFSTSHARSSFPSTPLSITKCGQEIGVLHVKNNAIAPEVVVAKFRAKATQIPHISRGCNSTCNRMSSTCLTSLFLSDIKVAG
jgi:hypothetical protein